MVARLSKALSLECGLHYDLAERVSEAAKLHDIGKSEVPAEILSKPGELTGGEFTILKNHTTAGVTILCGMPVKNIEIAVNIVLWHHERYDGKGYWGRFADELPLYVSIVSIIDVYVALIHDRVYKSAWTKKIALEYIRGESGTRFNPMLVKIFLALMQSGGFE